MIMTPEERIDMLNLIKECRQLSEQKTNIIEEVILAAQAVAAENAVLKIENETLKRHLSIAENEIQRMKRLERITEMGEEERYTRGVWAPARSVSESIANGWSGA